MDDVTRRRPAVRFGEFELDHSGELRSGARKIKLQEQPSQILRILLERAGEIVTREELRQKIWPPTRSWISITASTMPSSDCVKR